MGKTTGLYQCPSCSQPLHFRSMDTRLIVCPSCGKAVNRLESDDLGVKPISLISYQNDWLKVGTEGDIAGQLFSIIGRWRVWLGESVINYWTILFTDGTTTLLMEGYGMYALLQRVMPDKVLDAAEIARVKVGEPCSISSESDYFLQRRDRCKWFEIEGEVLLPECKDQFFICDFYAAAGKPIEIIEFLPGYLVMYQVQYMSYASFGFSGLNDGTPTPKEVDCNYCHGKVVVKTFPYAQSCSCFGCGAQLVFNASSGWRASDKDGSNNNQLDLPLGSVGVLKGISYEVIGYAKKRDNLEMRSIWKEYVLYNRAEGYAFLSEFEGNWIYARERGESPVLQWSDDPLSIYYKGEEFQLYSKYKIEILDSAGEFPYNIYDDEAIISAEYIAPPQMWVYEKSREEGFNWFYAESQDRAELAAQFPYEIPQKEGVGLLEQKGTVHPGKLIQVTLIAVAVMVLVHFLIGFGQDNKVLLDMNLPFKDSAGAVSFVSEPFTLHQWRSNLKFEIDAPVDNSWVDMEASLVNTGTGTEMRLDQPVEYYHGYEDGDSWSEGSMTETTYLNSIPSGTYKLRIETTRDTASSGWNTVRQFGLKVTNDAPNHRNLWIFLGLLLIWPVSWYLWTRFVNKQRWESSPYSPYKNEHS